MARHDARRPRKHGSRAKNLDQLPSNGRLSACHSALAEIRHPSGVLPRQRDGSLPALALKPSLIAHFVNARLSHRRRNKPELYNTKSNDDVD